MTSLLGTLMGFSLLLGSGPLSFVSGTNTSQVTTSPPVPSYTVTVTAYNAVPEQTDSNPFETASGAYSNPEVVAARSQDLAAELPFGTIVEFDGSATAPEGTCGFNAVAPEVGYRVIADTMNARYNDRVDILFNTEKEYMNASRTPMNAAMVLGICGNITIRVVGFVPINHIPKTQAALAALVHGGVTELAINK